MSPTQIMAQQKFFILLLILMGFHTIAQEKELLTVEEAVSIALENNYQIKIAANGKEWVIEILRSRGNRNGSLSLYKILCFGKILFKAFRTKSVSLTLVG